MRKSILLFTFCLAAAIFHGCKKAPEKQSRTNETVEYWLQKAKEEIPKIDDVEQRRHINYFYFHALCKSGQYARAEAFLKQQPKDQHDMLWHSMACAHADQGNLKAAIEVVNNIKAPKRQDGTRGELVYRTFNEGSGFDAALDLAGRIRDEDIRSSRLLWLSRNAARSGMFDQAGVAAKRIPDEKRRQAARNIIACWRAIQRDGPAAIESLKAKYPYVVQTWSVWPVMVRKGRFDEAVKSVLLIPRCSQRITAYLSLAVKLHELGHGERARACLSRGVSEWEDYCRNVDKIRAGGEGTSPPTYLGKVAVAQARLGLHEEARRTIQQVLKISRSWHGPGISLVRAWLEMDDVDAAISYATREDGTLIPNLAGTILRKLIAAGDRDAIISFVKKSATPDQRARLWLLAACVAVTGEKNGGS